MAEFDFITQTSVPSIEFDVCRDIEKFKSILRQKLGKKEGTELSLWQKGLSIIGLGGNEEQKEKTDKYDDKKSKKKNKNKKYGQAESDSDVERAKIESER